MKDLFRNYHKYNVLKNISVVWVSFVLALWINLALVWNDATSWLKASVVDAVQKQEKSDLEVIKSPDNYWVISHKDMSDVNEISFSLVYDRTRVELLELIQSKTDANVSIIENQWWYKTIIIRYDTPIDIQARSFVISFSAQKEGDSASYINMVNANFKDIDGNTFLLSTWGLIF